MPWKCSPKLRRSPVRACFEQILPEKPEEGEGYEEDRSEELEEPEKPEDHEDYEKLEELSDPEGQEELLKPEGFASREDSMSFTPGGDPGEDGLQLENMVRERTEAFASFTKMGAMTNAFEVLFYDLDFMLFI